MTSKNASNMDVAEKKHSKFYLCPFGCHHCILLPYWTFLWTFRFFVSLHQHEDIKTDRWFTKMLSLLWCKIRAYLFARTVLHRKWNIMFATTYQNAKINKQCWGLHVNFNITKLCWRISKWTSDILRYFLSCFANVWWLGAEKHMSPCILIWNFIQFDLLYSEWCVYMKQFFHPNLNIRLHT